MDTIKSKNNVEIRLTKERWFHITEEHSEMAGYYFDVLETVEEPEIIFKGNSDEKIAIKQIAEGKYIVVVYKELNLQDGFIITAFLTRRKKQLEKREKLWEQQK